MSTIVKIKRVANGKFQGELVDKIKKSGTVNMLALLNKGDKDFQNIGKPRHAWFPVTLESMKELGFSEEKVDRISKLKKDEFEDCMLENPEMGGEKLRIQINETQLPSNDWERTNKLKAAKQLLITPEVATRNNLPSEVDLVEYIGESGYFLTLDGKFIFSKASVVAESTVRHTFIDKFVFVPQSELEALGYELHDPVKMGADEGVTKGESKSEKVDF